MDKMDIASDIANTRYDHLPSELAAITKKFIIDSIGVGLAGSCAPENSEINYSTVTRCRSTMRMSA